MFQWLYRFAMAACGALLIFGLFPMCSQAEPATSVDTIDVQEVKDDEAADANETIGLDDVASVRSISRDRIYGLLGLWVLIALAVLLVRHQIKDDERLYQEGYYKKRQDAF